MVERIKEIILSEGLTSGSFADLIGVQRSSMSHILNGRNNPSLDFVVKTLQHFPKINPEWLLTGEGEMLKTAIQDQPTQPSRARSIFDSVPETPKKVAPIPEEVIKPAPESRQEVEFAPAAPEPPSAPIQSIQRNVVEIQQDTVRNDQRYVNKVLIFYSDRTYDEFLKTQNPEI